MHESSCLLSVKERGSRGTRGLLLRHGTALHLLSIRVCPTTRVVLGFAVLCSALLCSSLLFALLPSSALFWLLLAASFCAKCAIPSPSLRLRFLAGPCSIRIIGSDAGAAIALKQGMATRCPPDDPMPSLDATAIATVNASANATASALHYSDDERSIAADSWSVRSEYGSTLDGDDQRNADVVDALNASFRSGPSDYTSDKEEQDAEVEPSVLGLQSHWDSTYSDELTNFLEQGDAGEIWFGEEVMETMAAWTARICIAVAAGLPCDNVDGCALGTRDLGHVSAGGSMALELANWNVLDLGTGNGLLLHALAKQGFTDLTGTDYSEAGVELARAISMRSNVDNITFLVDDVLDTKINQEYKLVTDKGTLDAIGLHPDGPARRILYWKSVCKLLAPGGILVITSCNSTKDELIAEVNRFNRLQKNNGCDGKDDKDEKQANGPYLGSTEPMLEHIDHVRTYPTFRFGGVEGSRVSTVAFILRD